MRIDFERTGGFAGMRVTVTVNIESLSPEDAQDLREMVDGAEFFDLPEVITTPAPGADRFHYKLTVEDEEREHTVEMGEAAMPETLQPLIQRLTEVARSTRDSQNMTGASP
jgi:hypothetical protein